MSTIVDGNSGGTATTTTSTDTLTNKTLTSPVIGTGLTWPDGVVQSRVGWQKIAADAVPSSASSVDFTGIPSSVKALRLIYDLIPATNGVHLYMRLSQSGAFITSASYSYVTFNGGAGADISAAGAQGLTVAPICNFGIYNIANSATGAGVTGVFDLPNIQTARYVSGVGSHRALNTGNGAQYTSHSSAMLLGAAGAIDGVRLLFSGGNIDQSRVSLLGLLA